MSKKAIAMQKNILIVEDHKLSALALIAMLEDPNHNIIHVENGRSAITAYKKYRFDIIFCDQNLPDISGSDVIQKIRELNKRKRSFIPAISISANTFTDEQKQSLPFDDYVLKPATHQILTKMLSKFSNTTDQEGAAHGKRCK